MEITRQDLTMVDITLKEGSTNTRKFQGAFVYLQDGQRLSDLMNDDRAFIPMYKPDTMYTGETYDVVMINKIFIVMIQESTKDKVDYGHRRY